MKNLLIAILILAAVPSFAGDKPPSETSIRELMALTDAKSLLDKMYQQLDGMMEQAMKQALGDHPINEEQQKLMAEMRAKVVELFRSQLGWDQLEPSYLTLYQQTLTQDEVNGMLKFYKSKAGKAVINKLPQLTQGVMQVVMEKMQGISPQLRAIQEDYVKRLVAAGK
jgi:uncharacterized protein